MEPRYRQTSPAYPVLLLHCLSHGVGCARATQRTDLGGNSSTRRALCNSTRATSILSIESRLMRLIFVTFMVCASVLAGDSRSPAEPESINDLRPKLEIARTKRTFHPLKLLRRLGRAESEFALRLSSWGIRPEVEAVGSPDVPRPGSLAETASSTPQGPLGGASH